MNDQDIRQAFLSEMESVHVSPGLTARTLAQMEGERKVKKKLTGSLALVMCLIIVFTAAAVAAANQAGLIDFMSRGANTGLPEDASTYIHENLAVGTSEDGAFTATVREAAFDGMTLYTVIDVTHRDGNAFFVHADSSTSDPASDLTMATGDNPTAEGTILDMWSAAGKGPMYQVTASFAGETEGIGPFASGDGIRQEDGTYTLYTETTLEEPASEKEFTMTIRLSPFADPEAGDQIDADNHISIPVTFTMKAEDIQEIICAFPAIEVKNCGITIDRVTLTRAAFETYMEISYTITDAEAYAKTDDGVTFMAVNADGEALPCGVRGSGYVECISGKPGEAGSVYIENETLYIEQQPSDIILRVFNCWDKGEYETVTIPLYEADTTSSAVGE